MKFPLFRLPPLVRQYVDVPIIDLVWHDEILKRQENRACRLSKAAAKRVYWLRMHNLDGSLKEQPGTVRG